MRVHEVHIRHEDGSVQVVEARAFGANAAVAQVLALGHGGVIFAVNNSSDQLAV
jgi:hypothetical protein